jgi:hypothetical protein
LHFVSTQTWPSFIARRSERRAKFADDL